MVTKLPGMDDEADLVLATKKDQADLLTAVLKASDDDADEEVIQPSVSEIIITNRFSSVCSIPHEAATLSPVGRLSSIRGLNCISSVGRLTFGVVLCREVVPFSEGPLLEVGVLTLLPCSSPSVVGVGVCPARQAPWPLSLVVVTWSTWR